MGQCLDLTLSIGSEFIYEKKFLSPIRLSSRAIQRLLVATNGKDVIVWPRPPGVQQAPKATRATRGEVPIRILR